MNYNQEILAYCPNFNRIVNFKYSSDDVITDKLVTVYRDFIFKADVHNEYDVKLVKEFDYVLIKYIEDYIFRKELKSEIVHIKIKRTCTDILRAIVESVLNIFDNYLYMTTRKVTIARWI